MPRNLGCIACKGPRTPRNCYRSIRQSGLAGDELAVEIAELQLLLKGSIPPTTKIILFVGCDSRPPYRNHEEPTKTMVGVVGGIPRDHNKTHIPWPLPRYPALWLKNPKPETRYPTNGVWYEPRGNPKKDQYGSIHEYTFNLDHGSHLRYIP